MAEGCTVLIQIIAATPPTIAALAALVHSVGNRRVMRGVSLAVNGEKDKAVREAFHEGRKAGKSEAQAGNECTDMAAT